jgi:hypothetical protein
MKKITGVELAVYFLSLFFFTYSGFEKNISDMVFFGFFTGFMFIRLTLKELLEK